MKLASALLIVLLGGASNAVAAVPDTLVQASGVRLMAETVASQVRRAAERRGGQVPDADLPALFMAELDARVDDAVAAAAERWFTSQPARHLAEVERNAAARANIEELRAVMASLDGVPVEDGDLLARLRTATRALEINLLIARYGYAAVLAGTESLPPQDALARASIELAPNRDFQLAQLRATQTFVYGDADTDAIRAYIEWAESPAGGSWFGAVQTALDASLQQWLATAPPPDSPEPQAGSGSGSGSGSDQ